MFSAMKKRHFSGTLVMEECQSLVGAKTRQPDDWSYITAEEQERRSN
jgi:hypothetical protein